MGELENITLGQLSQALGQLTMKATGVSTGSPDLYYEGGLFGRCDANGTLLNALVGPSGVESVLTWTGTDVMHEIIDMLTYMDSSGYAQSGPCADCGKPQLKICRQVSCFARLCQSTNEFAADELGIKKGPRAPIRVLFGNVTASDGTVMLRQGQQLTDKFFLELAAAGYNLRNRVHYEMWSGTGGTAGGYTSMTPLSMLINTGYGDALVWNTPCNALDSLMINYGTNIVGAAGSPNIYTYLARLIRGLEYRARGGGFDWDTATTYIVISHTLQDCLFDALACAYGQVCNSSQVTNNDALVVRKMADEWRNSKMITIDGRRYPVVVDNMMPYTNTSIGNSNVHCSDIYALTTSIGGRQVIYGQFQDFNTTFGAEAAWMQRTFSAQVPAAIDGGRYMMAFTNYGGFCFDARILTKPRVVVEMPWLSGRLQNVCCAEIANYPDPTPGDGLYWVNGGVQNTPVESLYGFCAQQTGSYGRSFYGR